MPRLLIFFCLALLPISARAQQSFYQPAELPRSVPVEARPIGEHTISPSVPKDSPAFPFRLASGEEAVAASSSPAPPALKLAPRSAEGKRQLDAPSPPTTGGAIGSVVGSLAVVLGLFLAVVWVSRRFAPQGSAILPKEVVELLGRAPLAGRHTMQLVRVGNKLLLLALSSNGAETLTEVTDPVEVEHLAALCRRGKTDSATASFTTVLGQLTQEPSSGLGSHARGLTASSPSPSRGAT